MDQHLELESLGILRQTKVPPELAWMGDAEKSFLLEIYLAGEGGLSKKAAQKFEKQHPAEFLNITIRDLAQWESDKSGRPVALAVTWKGEEVAKLLLQIAKNESKKAFKQQVTSSTSNS